MAYRQCRCKNINKCSVRNQHRNGDDVNNYSELNQTITNMNNKLDKALEDLAILKAKADAILRQTFELAEFPVPRLFIILPEYTPRYNPAHWFHLNYRLYFLCECENNDEPHLAFHEGYKIKQPREFLRIYGPYLCKMLIVVKCLLSVGSLIVPQLSPIASGIPTSIIPKNSYSWNNLSIRLECLAEILTEAGKSFNISTDKRVQHVEGAALRGIESFLKKTDEHRKFGNLFRTATNDGHVRWVCLQHYDTDYSNSVKIDLREEFEKLEGEIKEDVAIIQGNAANKLSKMLNLFRRGLPIFSIILKNCKLGENIFDDLLNCVSKQACIRNLEIENITVTSFPFKIKKRDIISKLNETVKANAKLNIQYSFTKLLSKFSSKLIDAITKTGPRLTFRLRSQEDTPSLELAGSKETGFTLSINNTDENNNINYHTAIRNIYSLLPNITKIFLHKGVLSESIWILFHDFLTRQESLQELTLDCRLTIEQTELLYRTLSYSTALKTLHILDVWESKDELDGCKHIFKILEINNSLVEFTLTCSTNQLRLDFDDSRSAKCQIHQNTNVELFENFLQNFSIHTLSLESIYFDCEASVKRLIRAVEKNKNLKTLELKGSDCFAVFNRIDQIPESEKYVVPSSSSVQSSVRRSRSKLKRLFALFSCHKGEPDRHSHDETILPKQNDNSKKISPEPFYTLCNYPPLYKEIQEMTQNFKLQELEVTLEDHIEMTDIPLCMKSNLTVTRLRISKREVIGEDIQMLVEALRDNTTITHLNLNEIKISIDKFGQIFDVLRDDRTLRVLLVEQCISHFDRDSFIKKVKELKINNPSLKIVYENS